MIVLNIFKSHLDHKKYNHKTILIYIYIKTMKISITIAAKVATGGRTLQQKKIFLYILRTTMVLKTLK